MMLDTNFSIEMRASQAEKYFIDGWPVTKDQYRQRAVLAEVLDLSPHSVIPEINDPVWQTTFDAPD